MNNTIVIDNVVYNIVTIDYINDMYINCDNLEKGKAFYYYDKIVYRTNEGDCRACYRDDVSNNWCI